VSSIAAAATRSYLARFLLAFFAAFVLVYFASVAVGGRGHDILSLSAGAMVTCVVALLAASVSAFLVRRDLPLVLLSQAITIVATAALNFWA
jgi:hypothetical protein